jgi:hypothetical protein
MASLDHPTAAQARLLPPIAPAGPRDRLLTSELHEVRETRAEWSDYEFHYDLRFTIQDKPVYIETRLNYKMPVVLDESTILVVNIHAP